MAALTESELSSSISLGSSSPAPIGAVGQSSSAVPRQALAAMAMSPDGAQALAHAANVIRRAKSSSAAKPKAARMGNAQLSAALSSLPKRGPAKTTTYALPFADIANCLGLPFETAIELFSNGRAYSQIGEEHAAVMMGFDLHSHKDVRGTDGFRVDPATGAKLLVSVKSAAKTNVKFQLSAHTGAGRTCSEQDLLDSISQAATIVVVDVRHLPHVRITEFPAQCAVDWIAAKILSPSGMSAERFYLACGASCSAIISGVHDFARELAELAKANAAAERARAAANPPPPENPFVPSPEFLAAIKPPKTPKAKPGFTPIIGSPVGSIQPPPSQHPQA